MLITTATPGVSKPEEAWIVKCTIEGLAAAARPFLRSRGVPPLYESGVRFQMEPNHGRFEEFALPWTTWERGWGDCDDLVIWRIAELPGATCATKWLGNEFHVQVRLRSGKIEDPAIRLGAPFNWPIEHLLR